MQGWWPCQKRPQQPVIIVRLLCYWYSTQEFCIKWGNSTSSFFYTTNGVRQGGILSPRLFAIYIDDLSTRLNTLNAGCYIDVTCMNHFFYADDICLLAPSPLGLQILLNECNQYGKTHDIMFHPVKSKCMVVKPTGYNLNVPSMYLGEIMLEVTNDIKYLGVTLNNNLKDDIDMKRQLRSLYASANSVISKFALCSIPVKCHLIESYCLSFYCSYLCCDFIKSSQSKLRVAYNNIYRKILGYGKRDSASSMLVNANIDTFEARMRKSCNNFKQRILNSKNTIVQCITENDWVRQNYLWKHWDSLLYANNM